MATNDELQRGMEQLEASDARLRAADDAHVAALHALELEVAKIPGNIQAVDTKIDTKVDALTAKIDADNVANNLKFDFHNRKMNAVLAGILLIAAGVFSQVIKDVHLPRITSTTSAAQAATIYRKR